MANKVKTLFKLLILLCVFALLPSLSAGDSIEYLYDANGRLIKANKADNTRVLYQYDEVGNLIGIYKETSASQPLPPVLSGINPDIFLIGESYNVVITGQNLLTTTSVTSDNPDVMINFTAAIDSKVIAVLSIADSASAGQANITVTTSYGSASMTINLYVANITPEEISLFPGSTATMAVSLNPSASRDVTVEVNNKTPDIIDTPSSVTIPVGGSGDFTVKALKGGTGTINIGNAEAIVYVIGGDDDSRGAIIESAPVSVSIGDVPSDTVISSMPVSVNIGYISEGSIISSSPVSVQWLEIANGITISQQVSVEICSAFAVMVSGAATNYYSSLQTAYDNASDGDTIKVQAVTLTENVNFNRNISVTLEGGYDCDYMTVVGNTGLKGMMTISGGTAKVKNFILKK